MADPTADAFFQSASASAPPAPPSDSAAASDRPSIPTSSNGVVRDSAPHALIEVVMALEHIGAFASYEPEWERSLLGVTPVEARQWATLLLFAYTGGELSARGIAARLETDTTYRALGGARELSFEELTTFRDQHRVSVIGMFAEMLATLSACGLPRFRHTTLQTIADAPTDMVRTLAAKDIAESLVSAACERDAEEDAHFGDEVRGDELPSAMRDRAGRHERIAQVIAQRQSGATGDRWDEPTQLIDLAALTQHVLPTPADPSGWFDHVAQPLPGGGRFKTGDESVVSEMLVPPDGRIPRPSAPPETRPRVDRRTVARVFAESDSYDAIASDTEGADTGTRALAKEAELERASKIELPVEVDGARSAAAEPSESPHVADIAPHFESPGFSEVQVDRPSLTSGAPAPSAADPRAASSPRLEGDGGFFVPSMERERTSGGVASEARSTDAPARATGGQERGPRGSALPGPPTSPPGVDAEPGVLSELQTRTPLPSANLKAVSERSSGADDARRRPPPPLPVEEFPTANALSGIAAAREASASMPSAPPRPSSGSTEVAVPADLEAAVRNATSEVRAVPESDGLRTTLVAGAIIGVVIVGALLYLLLS